MRASRSKLNGSPTAIKSSMTQLTVALTFAALTLVKVESLKRALLSHQRSYISDMVDIYWPSNITLKNPHQGLTQRDKSGSVKLSVGCLVPSVCQEKVREL